MDLTPLLSEIEGALRERLVPVVERSQKALEEDAAGKPFEKVAFETSIVALLLVLAALIVRHAALALKGGKVANSHACTCGGYLMVKDYCEKDIGFLFGMVRLKRRYYACSQCGRKRFPLQWVWGIDEEECPTGKRFLTPAARNALVTMCAAVGYVAARTHFCVLTGVSVSAMTAWRCVQTVGKALRERVESKTEEIPLAKGAAPKKGRGLLKWLVGADGIMVAFWKNEKRRPRKDEAAKAAWETANKVEYREVKVGVVAQLDEKGAVVPGSQWYVISRAVAARFRPRLARVARAMGMWTVDTVAFVSDGAKWLRALATRHFPHAVAIRDFYHAAEHLGAMGAALYGEGNWRATLWQLRMAHRLKEEDLGDLLAEWARTRRKPLDMAAWKREMSYFRSQQEAMAYRRFREQGLPIGSGAIEGACKSGVGVRFKLPGARWTEEGFANLAEIRARYCSGVPIKP